ncbi:MAG: AMP-binding protein [Acidimicrobiales bacterium]|nr:AMP-binding protein [Acidimicrobiales bacterium]MDG1845854.1 AMP-binding protein [Acidimicrobiales bacterium]
MLVPLTVRDHIDRADLVYGKRVGVIDEPDQPARPLPNLTYADFAERAKAMAKGFEKLNVPLGGRVALVSQNSSRMLAFLFGTAAWGRVGVPINFRLNREEIKYIIEHSGSEILLVDPELADSLGDLPAKNVIVLGSETDRDIFSTGEPEPWEADENATATINYTSGTTARPKGVEMTHRMLWTNAAIFGWEAGVNDRDVYLHTLPMFHCNGWGMPFALTAMGVPQIVLRKVDGPEILRRVEKHGVTLMCGAPTVVASILEAASEWEGPIPGAGRTRIIVAGAPPPSSIIEQVETELNWEFIQIYGLTETAPLLTMSRGRSEWDDLTSGERAQRLGRAGAPALGVKIKVTDDGEILARSNHVLKGYWEQPKETKEAIRSGWFHTGDGGFVDDDNYVSIADRKKDVIISGGENVSSIEVEDVLFSHEAVIEAAVIGVPDEKWGETVKALVVVNGQITEQDLMDYCREKLAHYKCPTSIELRDELARTATGKLQKYKLRAPYWKNQDKQVN